MEHTSVKSRQQYSDPIAETQFRKTEDDLLALAKEQGRADGMRNIPVSDADFKARFANIVFETVQSELYDLAQHTQAISGVAVAHKIEREAKDSVRQLETELTDDRAHLHSLQRELKRCTPDRKLNLARILLTAGLILLSASDAVINYPAFRSVGLQTYSAIIAAVGIMVSIIVAAPLAAGYIRKSKTRFQYLRRLIGTHLVAASVFYALGLMRFHAATISYTADLDASEVTAAATKPDCAAVWATFITSCVLFSLAVLSSIKYYRSKDERRRDQEYADKRKKAAQLTEKIAKTSGTIAETMNASRQKQAEALQRYEWALAQQQRLTGLGARTLALYCATNIKHRTDGLHLPCFTTPPLHAYNAVFNHQAQ